MTEQFAENMKTTYKYFPPHTARFNVTGKYQMIFTKSPTQSLCLKRGERVRLGLVSYNGNPNRNPDPNPCPLSSI